MAIPTYEQFMHPFLNILMDGQEHTLSDLNELLI